MMYTRRREDQHYFFLACKILKLVSKKYKKNHFFLRDHETDNFTPQTLHIFYPFEAISCQFWPFIPSYHPMIIVTVKLRIDWLYHCRYLRSWTITILGYFRVCGSRKSNHTPWGTFLWGWSFEANSCQFRPFSSSYHLMIMIWFAQ